MTMILFRSWSSRQTTQVIRRSYYKGQRKTKRIPSTTTTATDSLPDSRSLSLPPVTTNNGTRSAKLAHPSQATVTSPSKQIRPARTSTPFLEISPEVLSALASNKPVVALETTIYTHGFPYPDNVTLALDLENIVRREGAVPATIGIVDGVATVGLSKGQITSLAKSAGKGETMKVSRRDIPYILGMGLTGRKLNGGTTVAATMYLAERSGIKVFGTGGLGGVHRGGQDTMDVSADLTELGKTSMAVVASGCKSFLDIPRTLEYLETQGCTVATFALERTGTIDFPAFYTQDSGVKSPMVVQDVKQAAGMIYAQELLGESFRSGMLLANPIPEKHAIPKVEIDVAINQAVQEAADQGIHGHANTPFILARIKELTKGNSIPANRALIESNVLMAAKLASALCRMRDNSSVQETPRNHLATIKTRKPKTENITYAIQGTEVKAIPASSPAPINPDILVFGSLAIDLSCDYSPVTKEASGKSESLPPPSSTGISPQMHTSNIATITNSIGGVGHNVALAAHRAGGALIVSLCSCVVDDLAGTTVLTALKEEGLDTTSIQILQSHPPEKHMLPARTAQYVSINDTQKNLVMAMADMSIFTNPLPRHQIENHPKKNVKCVVVDANWEPSKIRIYLKAAKRANAQVAFEPVSVQKSAGLFQRIEERGLKDDLLHVFPRNDIDFATPNQHELAAMHTSAKSSEHFESQRWWEVIDALGIPSSGARDRFVSITNHKMTDEGIPLQTVQLLPYIPTILTKLGSKGVLLTELLKPNDSRLTNPSHEPYILSRCTNGSTEVAGVYMRLFPAVEVVEDIVSVNGVGDTFLGVLVAGLAKGLKLDEKLIDIAQRGAVMTLRSREAVAPNLEVLATELDTLVQDTGILPGAEF